MYVIHILVICCKNCHFMSKIEQILGETKLFLISFCCLFMIIWCVFFSNCVSNFLTLNWSVISFLPAYFITYKKIIYSDFCDTYLIFSHQDLKELKLWLLLRSVSVCAASKVHEFSAGISLINLLVRLGYLNLASYFVKEVEKCAESITSNESETAEIKFKLMMSYYFFHTGKVILKLFSFWIPIKNYIFPTGECFLVFIHYNSAVLNNISHLFISLFSF